MKRISLLFLATIMIVASSCDTASAGRCRGVFRRRTAMHRSPQMTIAAATRPQANHKSVSGEKDGTDRVSPEANQHSAKESTTHSTVVYVEEEQIGEVLLELPGPGTSKEVESSE